MRQGKKTVIASVETYDDSKTTEVAVTNDRKVYLRFPKATFAYTSYVDFVKVLTPDEARAIGEALIDNADEVDARRG